MDAMTVIIVAVVIVLAVVAAGAYFAMQQQKQRRTDDLRGNFGPEYDRAVDQYGGKAESQLESRRERVQKLRLREIPREQREQLQASWTDTQARFVDEPAGAIADAERLVDDAMKARGYPVGDDLEQRYDDLSVEYGNVLDNYRQARSVSVARNDGEDVTTEDLRGAMVCYRALFTELLTTTAGAPAIESAGTRPSARPARQP